MREKRKKTKRKIVPGREGITVPSLDTPAAGQWHTSIIRFELQMQISVFSHMQLKNHLRPYSMIEKK